MRSVIVYNRSAGSNGISKSPYLIAVISSQNQV